MRITLSSHEREYLEEAAKSTILFDDHTAIMSRKEFDKLLTYSTSLPTGAFIGKRWKRQEQKPDKNGWPVFIDSWLMGEFAPNPDDKIVDLIWRKIEVIE